MIVSIGKDDLSFEKTDDGWREISVSHPGGRHKLELCYASQFSNPCRLRLDQKDLWVSVAVGTTKTDDDPIWFRDEATLDLGEAAGKCTIGFRPVVAGSPFPNIRAIQLVPEEHSHDTSLRRRGHECESSSSNSSERIVDASLRWRRAPTSVTFTFEIGIPSNVLQHQDVEYHELYLGSKAIKFRFGEAHDAVTIDGDPIGTNFGGETHPKVTFVEDDEVISTVILGLSSYTGEGAFTALSFERPRTKGLDGSSISAAMATKSAPKRPVVGAYLVEPTYVYDRKRLGLNLWITSLAAPIHQPVARYGFTLSSDDLLEFNPTEFQRFWDWLVQIKHKMASYRQDHDYEKEVHGKPLRDLDSVTSVMEDQRKFLLKSFSGNPANPLSIEGYLYGSRRHVSITFDVFSIYIYRLPDGQTFQATLFVDGKQYDTKKSRMEEIELTRNDVLAFAISLALRDTDLLFQMGLIRPRNRYVSEAFQADEAELLPLKTRMALFSGDYRNTVMARRAVTLLALAGLRMVSYETIMDDKDGWDIYDVAAGAASGMYQTKRQAVSELGAICCALIQIVVPLCLIVRGVQDDSFNEISWDVYIARLLFGTYAIFYEAKTWEVDNGDRVTGWLCFLPEFNTRKLILGLLVNKICKVSVSVAIVVLMIRSPTVFDVTLNALALYFIIDVDDDLVGDRMLETYKLYQRRELLNIKSKTALEYQLPSFCDEALPNLKNLPARYFKIASHRVSTATIAILLLGSIWMIIEPWVLGWTISI